jgi:hypothetical protein
VTWVLISVFVFKSNAGSDSLNSSSIFVHTAFTFMVCVEAYFIERSIFQLRVEHYAHKHPGDILPTSLRRGALQRSTSLARQRRSLPTYGSVLASSGVRTGDVEDSMIVQLPPPAYGYTRGSRLLLTGYLRNSMRARAREGGDDRAGQLSERPISYLSRDEEWEERLEAARARAVEEALGQLEEEPPIHTATPRNRWVQLLAPNRSSGDTSNWFSLFCGAVDIYIAFVMLLFILTCFAGDGLYYVLRLWFLAWMHVVRDH